MYAYKCVLYLYVSVTGWDYVVVVVAAAAADVAAAHSATDTKEAEAAFTTLVTGTR